MSQGSPKLKENDENMNEKRRKFVRKTVLSEKGAKNLLQGCLWAPFLEVWRTKSPPETTAKRLKTGCRAANAGSTGLRKPKQATGNRKDEIPGRQRPP